MEKVFNKIIEKIEKEEHQKQYQVLNTYDNGLCVAKKIVEEVEEQYKEEFEK